MQQLAYVLYFHRDLQCASGLLQQITLVCARRRSSSEPWVEGESKGCAQLCVRSLLRHFGKAHQQKLFISVPE